MIPLPHLNTRDERMRLRRTLTSSHQVKVYVGLTNLVGKDTRNLSGRFLSGQIDVDTSAEVTRTCNVEFYDPGNTIGIASNDPEDAGLYMHKMLEVVYSVRESDEDEWIDLPVFLGPIVKADRAEDIVTIEAQGKELLARAPLWEAFAAKKGDLLTNVIERLLVNRAGENPQNLMLAGRARLNKDYTFSPYNNNPWDAAKKLAAADDFYLFYDGAGRARMRKREQNHPEREFTDGENGEILTVPSISFDATEAKNSVVVKGGKNKAGKNIEAKAVLKASDPINPWRIGRRPKPNRDIVPRYLVEVIENDKINTKSDAEKIARNRLNALRKTQVEVQFDSVPVPHLEENDLLRLTYGGYVTDFFARQFTIPLVVGDAMPIGYNRRIRLGTGSPRVRATATKPPRRRKKNKATKKNRRRGRK